MIIKEDFVDNGVLYTEGRIIPTERYCHKDNIKKVIAPNCEKIGLWAFYKCKNLKEVNIPNCEVIGSYAFEGCENLTDINIPNNTEIDEFAFKDTPLEDEF